MGQDRKYHFKTYKSCFKGKHLVNWAVSNKVAVSRNDGIKFGEQLVELDIIRSSAGDDLAFQDSSFFYEFVTPLKRFRDFPTKYKDLIDHKHSPEQKECRKCTICERTNLCKLLEEVRSKCEYGFERDHLIQDRKY